MPLSVLTIDQMRALEADADQNGYPYDRMMQDAGGCVAELAAQRARDHFDSPVRVTVLVGSGGNGGDGLIAAVRLRQLLPDSQVRALLQTRREDDPLVEAALSAGVFVAYSEDDRDGRVIRQMVGSADLLIDAVLGFGARLPVKGEAQRILRFARQALNERANARQARPLNTPTAGGQVQRPPKQWVIAVDCPSGLDLDTGAADAYTLTADDSITFFAAKPGHLTGAGVSKVGQVHVAPLDLPESIRIDKRTAISLLDNEAMRDLLPDRPLDGHKGTFGKLAVLGGSDAMPGAAGLSARAAYRAGAGWVAVATTPQATHALQTHLLEAVWWPAVPDAERLADLDALIVGPGLGDGAHAAEVLRTALASARPLVIDASGLTAWAALPDRPTLPPDAILTPHPGEMATLLGQTTAEVQADRIGAAQRGAQAWGCVVVLKGAHTVIAAPNGKTALSPFKTDALAKAGTGDVLAGVIGALRAAGLPAYDAARLGVYLHGLSGVIAAEQAGHAVGVLASGVADAIPLAWSRLSRG